MIKRITLLIFMAINLNIYSQVVIKDKIVLYEITPDAVTLSTVTPAYGRLDLWYVINPTYEHSKVTLQIGALTVFVYGETYECPGGGGGIGDYVHMHWFDIPAETPISMEVVTCINEEWVNSPVSFGTWEQDGDYYYLDYTVQYEGDNTDSAKENNSIVTNQLRVFAQTPPGCANAQNQYCSEHGLQAPNVRSKPVDWTEGDLEKCDDYSGGNAHWAYFSIADEWLDEFNVSACFDKERQKWQFLTDNNNTLDINTAIKICENNLIFYFDFEIADSLDGVDTAYPCAKLIADLKRFKKYGEYDDGDLYSNAYVFRKLIYQHELLHVKEFQKNLDSKREKIYDNKYKELVDGFECEDFDNPEDAAEEIKEIIEDEWIADLINDAYSDDPIIAMQLLDLTEDQKEWIKLLESALHQEMYDIIDAWIDKADDCLD